MVDEASLAAKTNDKWTTGVHLSSNSFSRQGDGHGLASRALRQAMKELNAHISLLKRRKVWMGSWHWTFWCWT